VQWTPVFLSGQSTAWVGVYWQYPANNWGAKVGKEIAAGATKVSFYAASDAGGEKVRFIVGGMNSAKDDTLPYSDPFTASATITLTTSWTKYEIPLTESYQDVIGGFAWSLTTSATAPVTFYLDDVRWEH
jgi:hypothetical protein